ncbi:MAG: YHS domain-containing protein [Ancalomicrobiaceae bacterium]|nr:YHS domain-containing protein [Ancalomicrobiaceae bacterium]
MSFDSLINSAIFAAALLVMLRFGWGRHMRAHAQDHAQARAGGPPVAATEDIDPVCGMVVNRSSAVTATFGGKTSHFCSDSCRQRFEASPQTYAAKAFAAPHPAGPRHGCC